MLRKGRGDAGSPHRFIRVRPVIVFPPTGIRAGFMAFWSITKSRLRMKRSQKTKPHSGRGVNRRLSHPNGSSAAGHWPPTGGGSDILTKARRLMSKLKDLESQIQELLPGELTAFREGHAEFDADAWDQEFEADGKSGKLNALAERSLRGHNAGGSTQ